MDAALAHFLTRSGLVADLAHATVEKLDGGVSSDIWRVHEGATALAVKRALPRLRVAQEWNAPVSRNAAEVAWLREASIHAPGAVLPVLAHDPEAGLFAMPYLDPATHPVWKGRLRDGMVASETARRVGMGLAAIHAGTAGRPAIARRFDHADTFRALRIEPYLLATASLHADIAPMLTAIAAATEATRRCLIHGDVSPKNILEGADGPVFLDAECAHFGDPAFDLAFCLAHLLLKAVWVPSHGPAFLACYGRLAETYLARVSWEPATHLERRAARLLPALLLARIDGKSPVEYLTDARDKSRVRETARTAIARGSGGLEDMSRAWRAVFIQ